MINVISHIEYLLQKHDCVIVPNLGAVLAHGSVAYYDEKTAQWYPPRRVLSFNPELSRNDGLLAASIARRDGISIESATAKLKIAVEQMRHELYKSRLLSLGKVGNLRLNDSDRMMFETADTAWLSPTNIWLPNFELRPVVSASKVAREFEDEETRRSRISLYLRRTGQIAASIAVILTIGWVAMTKLPDTVTEQFASFVPTVEVVDDNFDKLEPISTMVLVVKHHDDASEAVESPAEVANAQISVANSEIRLDESDNYFLIVASLASKSEAEKYLSQHSDFKLGMLTIDGRYRIYAASGTTQSQVMAAAKLSEIASRYPSTWVCRK